MYTLRKNRTKSKINPKLKRNGVGWLPYAAHKNLLKIEKDIKARTKICKVLKGKCRGISS